MFSAAINLTDNKQKSLLAYLLISAIGLMGSVFGLINAKVGAIVASINHTLDYADWASLVVATEKPVALAGYVGVIAVLFIYFFALTILACTRYFKILSDRFDRAYFNWILLLNIFCFLALFKNHSLAAWAGITLFWLVASILPYLVTHEQLCKRAFILIDHVKVSRFIAMILLTLVFGVVIAAVSPYFNRQALFVSNDFLWVPEATKIDNQYIENVPYLKEHGIHHLFGGNKAKSESEMEFVSKNQLEMQHQLVIGHYFHHQNAMLGPISDIEMGRDPSDITFVYGVGNAYFLTHLISMFHDGLTFENYIAALYSFVILYFLLFALTGYALLRDIRYTMLAVVLGISMYLLIGFEALRMAPGFNPIRHFLDLPLLLACHAYFFSDRCKKLYLIVAYLIAAIAILANAEFGAMMLASFTAACVLYALGTKRFSDLVVVIVGFCLSLVAYVKISAVGSAQSLALYSMLGVSVAPTSKIVLFGLMGLIILGYAGIFLLITKWGFKNPAIYMALLLLFYSQCLWLYFIWYTEPGHLLMTSPIWVLFGVYMVQQIVTAYADLQSEERVITAGALCAILLLLASSAIYFSGMNKYNRVFSHHKIYQWNFPRAHLLSTMNPSVFAEAIGLIRQYNPDDDIYIISKYDNILPFLAGKFNNMPFPVLSTSLVTQREIDLSADAILTAKPTYLFVDADIDRSADVIYPRDSMGVVMSSKENMSYGRALVLKELQNVFNKVSNQYKLVATGYLINVYQRK